MQCQEIEVYLSGYLDRELTQQQDQRVRLHLERCAHCRAVLGDLERVSAGTARLEFEQPEKKEWDTMQENLLERTSRRLGWVFLTVWAILTAGYSLYQFATTPTEHLFPKILVFGLLAGIVLVFLSILSERLRALKTDRYKGVEK